MADFDQADAVIVTVRLRSGRFESSIEVPLFCSKGERDAFVEAWLLLMVAGINCGQGRTVDG